MAKLLLDRLRDMSCDRDPFTPSHRDCICLITTDAANEIERLQAIIGMALANIDDVGTETLREILATKVER